MKKVSIIFVIIAIAFCYFPSSTLGLQTSAPDKSGKVIMDMPDEDFWSTPALKAAVRNGLLNGFDEEDGIYIRPNDTLTRAQAAAIVNRAFGTKETAELLGVTDVSEGSWYFSDIQKAVSMGTMMLDTKMRPNDNITRQEAFTILARALKMEEGTRKDLEKFNDASHVASWATSGMGAMVKAGYIRGNNNLLSPKANMTRAQFAVVIYNVILEGDLIIGGDGAKVINISQNKEYGTIKDAINDESIMDGDTIVLQDDIKIDSYDFMDIGGQYAVMIPGKKLTLDLNGKTLSANAEATIYIGYSGELTLKDKSIAANGKVINTKYSALSNYGTFIMENGELFSPNSYALYNYQNNESILGKAVIKGGTLKGGKLGIASVGNLEISGGNIRGTDYDIVNSGKLTISGDVRINKMMLRDGSSSYVLAKGTMTINDGATLSGVNENSFIEKEMAAKIFIEGTNNFTALDGLGFKWDGSKWLALGNLHSPTK